MPSIKNAQNNPMQTLSNKLMQFLTLRPEHYIDQAV